MINPYLIFSGIGMMLVGIVPVLWWRYRTLVPWRDFWLGAFVWAIAIAVKVVMDLTVTPMLVNWTAGVYTALGIAIITGAYVGLRTGLLESGLTYIIALKENMKRFDFNQAVAFGLGFGGAEAFLLGIISFINIAVLLVFPQMIDLLTAVQKASLLEQLTVPDIMVFAPIIERAFTLMVHVFCSVLVIQAIRSERVEYFITSMLYKTFLDGMLPWLTLTFDRTTVAGVYSIELFVVALGTAGLGGLFWVKKRYGKKSGHKRGRKRFISFVCIATAVVIIIAILYAQPSVASRLERRTVDFDGFEGKYDFIVNDTVIGYSEFSFTGGVEYDGESAFIINEETNLSETGYDMDITGTLYTTVDARPLFYNMTIRKNGEVKEVICEFGDGFVSQTVSENNVTTTDWIAVSDDAFIVANNMLSHWALLFKAAKLEPRNAYIVRMYSPNAEMEVARTLDVTGVENVTVKGKPYEAYVFRDTLGNLNYVTPGGTLLKVENSALRITISEGEPPKEEGGIFR